MNSEEQFVINNKKKQRENTNEQSFDDSFTSENVIEISDNDTNTSDNESINTVYIENVTNDLRKKKNMNRYKEFLKTYYRRPYTKQQQQKYEYHIDKDEAKLANWYYSYNCSSSDKKNINKYYEKITKNK